MTTKRECDCGWEGEPKINSSGEDVELFCRSCGKLIGRVPKLGSF